MGHPNTPILTIPPQITYATAGVQPPAALYVDSNDSMLIQVITSVAGLNVQIGAKLLLPSGVIVPMQQNVMPASTRATSNGILPLQEGFLLGVTAFPLGPSIVRGQCWVRVMLLRAFPASPSFGQVLFSGYMTGQDVPTWPPGYYEPIRSGQGAIRSITGATPAAGAEISESVPAFAAWRPIAFRYSLVSNATVATRDSHLVIDDGVNILTELPSGTTQAASLTTKYNWASGLGIGTLSNGVVAVPLPTGALVDTLWRIRTNTVNLQPGDQYSAPQYLVEEWLEA